MELPVRPDLPLALRGYSPSAVDQHLDLLEAAIDDLVARLQLLRSERDCLQDALGAQEQQLQAIGSSSSESVESPSPDSGLEEMSRSIAEVLRGAYQEAATVRNRAQVTAAALVGDSQQRATALIEEAEQRAAALIEEAEQRAAALIDEAEQWAAALVEEGQERAAALVEEGQERAAASVKEDGLAGAAVPAPDATLREVLDPEVAAVPDDLSEAAPRDWDAIARFTAVPSRHWEV